MGISIDECQARINSRQFGELIAYNNIDNFTLDRAEYSLAIIASMLANALNKNQKFKASDFLLNSKPKKIDLTDIQTTLAKMYGHN